MPPGNRVQINIIKPNRKSQEKTQTAENVSKRIIRITIRVPSSGSCGPTCLAAARLRRGSDMPPACHSLPRRRFASLQGEGLYAAGFNIPLSIFHFQFSIKKKPAEAGFFSHPFLFFTVLTTVATAGARSTARENSMRKLNMITPVNT